MKKLSVIALGLLCATAIVVQAQDAASAPKKELTAEQKALMKDMLAKYDTNKDGKLDKTEKAAISKEDKAKMVKAGLINKPKPAAPAVTAPSTNAPAGGK